MRIDWNLADGLVLRRDRRTPLPRRFSATGETPALPGYEVRMAVEVSDLGQPRCVRLELRAPQGAAVTGQALRKLRVADLLREAVATAGAQLEYNEADQPTSGTRLDVRPLDAQADAYREILGNERRPRRGSPITAEHLREVARVYTEALDERPRAPTEKVAFELHAARSTAARWVAQAREQGFLPPATPGRAG